MVLSSKSLSCTSFFLSLVIYYATTLSLLAEHSKKKEPPVIQKALFDSNKY